MTPAKIKALRKREGLSQEALARKLNVSVQAVRQWEYGMRNPCGANKNKLVAIASGKPV